eukprot:g4695.t1
MSQPQSNPTPSASSRGPGATLHYTGANHFRQRLVLSTLSGRSVLIKQIRAEERKPGLRDYESNFLRLLDKITDGAKMEINTTGTQLRYEPGQLTGCKDRVVAHECPGSRGLTYWLEPLAMLLPFARNLTKVKLVGVTNDGLDLSVDSFRSVTLPWLTKLFAPVRYASPNGGDAAGAPPVPTSGTNNTALNSTVPQQNVFLHTNQTNFASDQLSLKVLRRGCGRGGATDAETDADGHDQQTPDGATGAASKGEVLFHCPTLSRVRPLNLTADFRCKRVRGVAFTSGVTPQYATRMCDAARGVLNDFLPDVWIFADHDKPEKKKAAGGEDKGKQRGFGLSLVAESIDGAYKSVDVFSNGELPPPERALLEVAGAALAASAKEDAAMEDAADDEEEEESTADESGGSDVEMKAADEKSCKPSEGIDRSLRDVPFGLGKAAACRLLSELSLGGCADSAHQILLIHYLTLAEEDEASRVRLGKLTPQTISYLRHVKEFFGVQFKMRQLEDDSVLLSCVGVGLANLSRPTF